MKNIKIWFTIRNETCETTAGTSPQYYSGFNKVPSVGDYLRTSEGNFYKVIDPIFVKNDEVEIVTSKVDESDSLWQEKTIQGNYVQLP